jgi:hypothetical protein
MMEQGFVHLLSGLLATQYPNMAPGFLVQTPPNFLSSANPVAWAYRSIISRPLFILEGQDALTATTLQVDALSISAKGSQTLANAICSALSGVWSGTFSDGTVVKGIFRLPAQIDGYIDESRSYVRSLEFTVQFYAS